MESLVEHRLLTETLEELQIRDQVEDVMKDMLLDVELALATNEELTHKIQQKELKDRVVLCEEALAASWEVKEKESQERSTLTDALLEEVCVLGRELGELKRWKKQQEASNMRYDELVAKLIQTEEEIQHLRSQPQPTMQQSEIISPTPAVLPRDSERENESSIDGLKGTNEETDETVIEKSNFAEEEKDAASVSAEVSPQTEDTITDDVSEEVAVVALIQEEDDETPTFEALEPAILLSVFNFLEATEILKVAQVNIAFYSRVDSLFGMSAEAAAKMPPKPKATVKKRTKKEPILSGGMFSVLQQPTSPPRKQQPKAKTPAKKTGAGGGLSANMAKSMEAKLNDNEINAIIAMTKDLRQIESEVSSLATTNAELHSKIEGTEAVKEFLVSKVRDMEAELAKKEEEKAKFTQQITTDQEVISYLDTRVQELERNERELTKQNTAFRDELAHSRSHVDSRISVLTDMLRFEKQKSRAAEKEWKSTKKVLKKEVKHCRSLLASLQKERDGMRRKNTALQKALLQPASSASPRHGDSRRNYAE